MAHRMGDKHSMALALSARHAARWLPGTVEERLDIAHELLNLAELVGDRDLVLQGHALLVAAYLELNDLQRRRREHRCRRPAGRGGAPSSVPVVEAALGRQPGHARRSPRGE